MEQGNIENHYHRYTFTGLTDSITESDRWRERAREREGREREGGEKEGWTNDRENREKKRGT